MRESKKSEVERFVDYLSSSKDLIFSKSAKARFKREVNIKHIIEGVGNYWDDKSKTYKQYDKKTSKLPPSLNGVKLSSKERKIAKRLGLSAETMKREIINEKYEVFLENKKIMKSTISPNLSDFRKFSSKKLEQKLAYKYASTKKKQQMSYKKGLNFNRNSRLGKALRDKGISYKTFDKDKITLGYNQPLSDELYELNVWEYVKKGQKPPSPIPIKEAVYDIWYDGVDTGIKIKTTDIEQLFSNSTKRDYEII